MKTINSSEGNTATAAHSFAAYVDGFERALLEGMSEIEDMLEAGGHWLEEIDDGWTVKALTSLLVQVGDVRGAISDLRVNNLRVVLKSLRPAPALTQAA